MKILWPIILTILMFSGSKSVVNTNNQSNSSQDKKLIKSYVVDNKWGSFYTYNVDNTLQGIVYKEDGVVQCTEVFTYKKGKISELLKKNTKSGVVVKKHFKYKRGLIVKQTRYEDGKLSSTTQFLYDKNNFLKEISEKGVHNKYEYSKTTYIEKIAENKIRVKRENVATHIITYDDKQTPESVISGYKPLVQINNNGIAGNVLLTEIYTGSDNKPSTTITPEIKFDSDGETVLSSKITYSSPEKKFLEIQEFKYNYYKK